MTTTVGVKGLKLYARVTRDGATCCLDVTYSWKRETTMLIWLGFVILGATSMSGKAPGATG